MKRKHLPKEVRLTEEEPFTRTRFVIGDPITVRATVRGKLFTDFANVRKRGVYRNVLDIPIRGCITGIKRLLTGNVQKTNSDGSGYVRCDNFYHVWALRVGLMNREIYALDRDLDVAEDVRNFPLLQTLSNDAVVRRRDIARRRAARQTRDAKGQFVKNTPAPAKVVLGKF